MAASIIVRERSARSDRARNAIVSARTAPRGPGLAPVVPLPLRGPLGAVRADMAPEADGPTPALRSPALQVVPKAPGRARGAARVLLLLVAVTVLVGTAGLSRAALAGPVETDVLGHVVLQPGETLWDIAVRSAPAGVDPRRQVDTLRRINGFGPGPLDAWTVVLIPSP